MKQTLNTILTTIESLATAAIYAVLAWLLLGFILGDAKIVISVIGG